MGFEPGKRIAVVACMDARVMPLRLLGLEEGDAHVIRNAGGLATDDALRSLAISQRFLGTRKVVVLHHTDCGIHPLDGARLSAELVAETGQEPPWPAETPDELADGLRGALEQIRACPFLLHRDDVRGFVYDVESGELRESG